MNRFFTFLAAVTLATPALADWNLIDSKAEFKQLVVGNNFVHQKSKAWFQFTSDGKLTGAAAGGALTGKWRWTGGRACYSRKLGGKSYPRDCVTIWVDGNKAVTKRKSDGREVPYLISN